MRVVSRPSLPPSPVLVGATRRFTAPGRGEERHHDRGAGELGARRAFELTAPNSTRAPDHHAIAARSRGAATHARPATLAISSARPRAGPAITCLATEGHRLVGTAAVVPCQRPLSERALAVDTLGISIFADVTPSSRADCWVLQSSEYAGLNTIRQGSKIVVAISVGRSRSDPSRR